MGEQTDLFGDCMSLPEPKDNPMYWYEIAYRNMELREIKRQEQLYKKQEEYRTKEND